jgi:methionine-rich copper-binding protein CopC
MFAILALVPLAASVAWAHAFLDHAAPGVGSSPSTAPAAISIWFAQELEPAFSTVEVLDQAGNHVDARDAKAGATDATILRTTLKPLPPGIYKVAWRVVSVDTGTFYFCVGLIVLQKVSRMDQRRNVRSAAGRGLNLLCHCRQINVARFLA